MKKQNNCLRTWMGHRRYDWHRVRQNRGITATLVLLFFFVSIQSFAFAGMDDDNIVSGKFRVITVEEERALSDALALKAMMPEQPDLSVPPDLQK
ncbi:MAG: hypothetical protein ABIK28_05950, partial [Planctomycetota bacterium]